MRTIFEFPAENAKIADCLADGAVLCELLSGSNSLIIRENTGNYRDFGHLGVELGPNKPVFSRVFVEIPYSTEQGIILEEQGIFSM